MIYFSTNNKEETASLKQAVIKGLAPDKGLYMPERIRTFTPEFIANISNYSFPEIAFETAKLYFGDDIPEQHLKDLVYDAINFDAPVVRLNDQLSVLELWHGPTLAFKDFGARFMARMLSYFLKGRDQTVHVLVATSGDTGSAVANGFLGVDGIQVHILYPKGKVSEIQEKQMTTLGKNISALEVDGVFDDCQAMVKQAFLDRILNDRMYLTSANSINIARLFPQSFYYNYAYAQMDPAKGPVVFCVPSGNFGNITSGLLAQKMGLPVTNFIAATNSNKAVPNYLGSGIYEPTPSVQTISNAMDVGDPSNFARMQNIFSHNWEEMKSVIRAYSFDDDSTKSAIREIFEEFKYLMDPHGSVGYLAAKEHLKGNPNDQVVILETAHPAKFSDVVENAVDSTVEVPEKLRSCLDKEKKSRPISNDFEELRSYLMSL